MCIYTQDLPHMLKILARNLDGTSARHEWVVIVNPQASGAFPDDQRNISLAAGD
jgi:hypothetical protein